MSSSSQSVFQSDTSKRKFPIKENGGSTPRKLLHVLSEPTQTDKVHFKRCILFKIMTWENVFVAAIRMLPNFIVIKRLFFILTFHYWFSAFVNFIKCMQSFLIKLNRKSISDCGIIERLA